MRVNGVIFNFLATLPKEFRMDRISSLVGKPIPQFIDETEHEKCEYCGTELVSNCVICGAPVCCPKCCNESQLEN